MKKIAAITINNFSLLPVTRFILESLSGKFRLSVVECFIKGTYDYSEFAKVYHLEHFASLAEFRQQSLLKRSLKYLKLHWRIFEMFVLRNHKILYTPDIHVLIAFFNLNKLFRKRVTVVYHQFELLDTEVLNSKDKRLWNQFVKHVSKISLVIFPEANRLGFFCRKVDFDETKCMVIPNSCAIVKSKGIKPEPLRDIPDDHLIVAHIGNVGANHYLINFLRLIDEMQDRSDIHFLMIGRFNSELQNMFKGVRNSNFKTISELPHSELADYYSHIDIGFILYKGLDLNLEFCAPNKLYEYWSHGIFVFGHPLKGLQGVLTDEKMGRLVDLEDISEIKRLIQKFRQDSTKNTREDIRKIFHERFSINRSLSMLNERMDEYT